LPVSRAAGSGFSKLIELEATRDLVVVATHSSHELAPHKDNEQFTLQQ